jgi:hypothetical protein
MSSPRRGVAAIQRRARRMPISMPTARLHPRLAYAEEERSMGVGETRSRDAFRGPSRGESDRRRRLAHPDRGGTSDHGKPHRESADRDAGASALAPEPRTLTLWRSALSSWVVASKPGPLRQAVDVSFVVSCEDVTPPRAQSAERGFLPRDHGPIARARARRCLAARHAMRYLRSGATRHAQSVFANRLLSFLGRGGLSISAVHFILCRWGELPWSR